MATITRGIPLSKISPKFLHSNSTSHTWPFSGIAELIDNAYDPDVNAREILIDNCTAKGMVLLMVEDDGGGMDFDHLLKMLSFGYCEKDTFENLVDHLPIGHYGNGFKSGSMRLGKDAVVFTACKKSASVGFLSQTYLEAIGADCVFVPMIEYRLPNLERFKSQESRNNLDAILQYSPFSTEQELKAELRAMCRKRNGTGTKIFLYNLKRHSDGKLELDFESDSTDIRNPEAHEVDLTSVYHRTSQVESSEYLRSLREYCSILFLRPRMKIYIRGVKVQTHLITKSLSSTEIDIYRPTWLNKPLRIIFGFSTKTPLKEDYGVMFYHRNRLIKAYEKLGYQKQPNDLGVGVVGVVQVDFLKTIHNKQDFEKDEKYNAIMSAIGLKLNDYWNEKRSGPTAPVNPTPSQLPDWLWVQCERCLKWRRLPDNVRASKLPHQWYCHMNPDPTHNRCDILEEPEDEDEAVLRPTYTKTFKKKQEEKKKQKAKEIAAKEEELRRREEALLAAQRRQQQMNEVSSTQVNHRQQDIARLQRDLMEAKHREERQKRLIVKIQSQKRQVLDQQHSLVTAANSLRAATTNSAELLEVASGVTDSSAVSSTRYNSSQSESRKRRSDGDDSAANRKVMKITTDQGDMVTVERAESDNEQEDLGENSDDEVGTPSTITPARALATAVASVPAAATRSSPRTRRTSTQMSTPVLQTRHSSPRSTPAPQRSSSVRTRSRQQREMQEEVVDLTLDDDDVAFGTPATYGEVPEVKPNVEALNQQMVHSSTAEGTTSKNGHSGACDSEVCVKNEPGPGGSAVENGEGDSKLGQLRHKYRLLTQRFHNLQRNVYRLLTFIVPDADLGTEEDIEYIVTEMIRVNCDSQTGCSLVQSSAAASGEPSSSCSAAGVEACASVGSDHSSRRVSAEEVETSESPVREPQQETSLQDSSEQSCAPVKDQMFGRQNACVREERERTESPAGDTRHISLEQDMLENDGDVSLYQESAEQGDDFTFQKPADLTDVAASSERPLQISLRQDDVDQTAVAAPSQQECLVPPEQVTDTHQSTDENIEVPGLKDHESRDRVKDGSPDLDKADTLSEQADVNWPADSLEIVFSDAEDESLMLERPESSEQSNRTQPPCTETRGGCEDEQPPAMEGGDPDKGGEEGCTNMEQSEQQNRASQQGEQQELRDMTNELERGDDQLEHQDRASAELGQDEASSSLLLKCERGDEQRGDERREHRDGTDEPERGGQQQEHRDITIEPEQDEASSDILLKLEPEEEEAGREQGQTEPD